MLKISNFPHAEYNPATQTGWLALYYPHDAVKTGNLQSSQWRHESYSPEILNYKVGNDSDIDRFVSPMLHLISHVTSVENIWESVLVPVPTSIAWNDPNFNRNPRAKGGPRNRDNRNIVFCNRLGAADQNLKMANILRRIETKPPKATWSSDRHAKSLEVAQKRVEFFLPESSAFILIDDVTTNGGTLDGAELKLREMYSDVKIIKCAIGRSDDPAHFQPVSGN
ncbi:MAG: hypothetical protein IT285_06665 [Bdellovibrionales bacterium]|nr:hypothetical protein [Bdellovibrionales bacterium]